MENPEKNFIQKISLKQIGMRSEETEQINKFIKMHYNGKLTQSIVQDWLVKLPKNKRKDAKYELEYGIAETFKNLPQ